MAVKLARLISVVRKDAVKGQVQRISRRVWIIGSGFRCGYGDNCQYSGGGVEGGDIVCHTSLSLSLLN